MKLPPKLASFDAVIEQIIPSSMYVPFQKFSLGNLHWRLKLACAYLFKKKGFDANTFAEEIPEDYVEKTFDLDKLVELSYNIDDSAAQFHKPQRSKTKKIVQNYQSDEEDADFIYLFYLFIC